MKCERGIEGEGVMGYGAEEVGKQWGQDPSMETELTRDDVITDDVTVTGPDVTFISPWKIAGES